MKPRRRRLAPLVAVTTAATLGACSTGGASLPAAGPAPSSPAVTVDQLDNHLACGDGFAVTNDTRTLAVEITVEGGVPATGPVGSDLWTGWLQVGADLDVDWCTDAPSTSPVVDENYLIVSGDLIIDDVQGTGSCPTVVRATLAEVVADSRNELIEWAGPIELTNERWGCFVG